EATAFSGNTGLTSLTLPDSVTGIPEYAFYYCTNLASVTIGKSLTRIDPSAFAYCDSLRSVYFMGNAPAGRLYFPGSDRVTAYYRLGTTGWTSTLSGQPAVLWVA